MTGEARAIARVLLARHGEMCRPLGLTADAVTGDDVRHCAIFYENLCAAAGVPHLTRVVGRFLGEIAEWCAAHSWPPLNSLAINKEAGMPGKGYDQAPNCSLLHRPEQVKNCIAFTGYPDHL